MGRRRRYIKRKGKKFGRYLKKTGKWYFDYRLKRWLKYRY